MAKTPAKAAATPKAADVLIGSDGLPPMVTTASGKVLFPGDIVRAAFEASGLTAEAWNALDAAQREELLVPFYTNTTPQFPEQQASSFKGSRRILVVSAPGGARRRAGLGFDVEPRELTEEELGATAEEVEARIAALRADPKLKIDTRLVEIDE